jgi:hypothetical protein
MKYFNLFLVYVLAGSLLALVNIFGIAFLAMIVCNYLLPLFDVYYHLDFSQCVAAGILYLIIRILCGPFSVKAK